LILLQPSSPHAFGDQTPFILGDRSANLEQELIVWILTHGSLHELDLATSSLQFFDEQHLMHILASESIWGGDDEPIKGCTTDLLSKPVESWAAQACSAVSIIAKDILLLPRPSLCLTVIL
jgi:hypothetical protein